jgi:hypothetical protein
VLLSTAQLPYTEYKRFYSAWLIRTAGKECILKSLFFFSAFIKFISDVTSTLCSTSSSLSA